MTIVAAWAVPFLDASLSFPATACTVTTAHATITCTLGASAGAALTWRVVVEGQANAVPQSSCAPPTLLSAAWVESGVHAAATTGGTPLSIIGADLGPTINFVAVTITVPAGDVAVAKDACSMPRPDVELVCALPAGTGPITRVGVSVLGQFTWLPVTSGTGLKYAAPVITSVSPGNWSTDLASAPMTVLMTGSGFGAATLSYLVSVSATGLPTGNGCARPIATIQNVNVRSDNEVVFEVRYTGSHVVPAWQLDVTVSGQRSMWGGVPVLSRSPSVPTPTFEAAPNGTHYFLVLTGTDFGPVVPSGIPAACSLDDVTVTVAGQPCSAVTMLKVRGVLVDGGTCDCRSSEGCKGPEGARGPCYVCAHLVSLC
jgi:hypothetical protein